MRSPGLCSLPQPPLTGGLDSSTAASTPPLLVAQQAQCGAHLHDVLPQNSPELRVQMLMYPANAASGEQPRTVNELPTASTPVPLLAGGQPSAGRDNRNQSQPGGWWQPGKGTPHSEEGRSSPTPVGPPRQSVERDGVSGTWEQLQSSEPPSGHLWVLGCLLRQDKGSSQPLFPDLVAALGEWVSGWPHPTSSSFSAPAVSLPEWVRV